ncbi:hypothetical protein BJX63DRAFT_52799 [Aspergillus granulosus]|uniref:Zn(2)-C6 fungal-type domain-containing protein n=1 Tax=Aspergillus granulosus TaxID=176169 RepID=A0ABR4GY04_9EURO
MTRPCLTCRSRKKACDGARPSCGTCSRSRRTCAGYDAPVKGVFVNLDASRVKKKPRMKSLIRDAIAANHQHNDGSLIITTKPNYSINSITALHTLNLSPAEFHAHFLSLWSHFQARYARSPTCWSLGLTDLGAHNRALDLAFISLATIRLSFTDTNPRNKYLVMSLSAYNIGLQTFRALLQTSSQETKPQLVVISLIFTLFEASQQKPTRMYQSGWAGHLTGALALMEHLGPGAFQSGGFHVAFQKLREMAVLLALSRAEKTFLARREWVEGPWAGRKKTHRDLLYDIAIKVTNLYAGLTSQSERRPDPLARCYELQDELHTWRRTWIESEHPTILPAYQHSKPPSYLPHPSLFPSNDFSYMSIDYVAFFLLLTYMATQISPYTTSSTPDYHTLQEHVSTLRYELQTILTLPCFGRAMSDIIGITEGRCHSLFPLWVLSRTAPILAPEEGEEDWWSGLYGLSGRLNYGID